MAGNLHPRRPQLLHQPPYLGAAGVNFLSDLRPADHDHGVLHQQADNVSQAEIGRLMFVRSRRFGWAGSLARAGRKSGLRPQTLAHANLARLADAEIMRESRRNDNA